MSVFDFRFWCFEVNPIAIGVKVNYSLDYQLYYMPKIKAYLPMTEIWSSSIALGPTFGLMNNSDGNCFQNTWFTAELAFRCHHKNSSVNTDLFIRYNEGFVVGVAFSFTKAWRTQY